MADSTTENSNFEVDNLSGEERNEEDDGDLNKVQLILWPQHTNNYNFKCSKWLLWFWNNNPYARNNLFVENATGCPTKIIMSLKIFIFLSLKVVFSGFIQADPGKPGNLKNLEKCYFYNKTQENLWNRKKNFQVLELKIIFTYLQEFTDSRMNNFQIIHHKNFLDSFSLINLPTA